MQIETYTLPEFWACALVNDDRSGMTDEDERELDNWFADAFPHGAHCVDVSSEEDGAGFTRWHDAYNFVGACNCLTFTFDVGGQ